MSQNARARVSPPGSAQDHDQFAPYERVTEGDEQYRRT